MIKMNKCKTRVLYREIYGIMLCNAYFILSRIFSIEPVEMVYEDHTEVVPTMASTSFSTNVGYINTGAGFDLKPEVMEKLLYKMQLPTKVCWAYFPIVDFKDS